MSVLLIKTMVLGVWTIVLMAYAPRNLPIRVKKMSTWMAFRLRNEKALEYMLPAGTELAPMRILSRDMLEPRLLFNIYESESSFFKGVRFEVVTMVKECRNPRKVHFVVLDCFSDTLQWDPKNGIQFPNLRCDLTTNANRHSIVCHSPSAKLELYGRMGKNRHITRMFAVDANFFCFFQDSLDGVQLKFDESEIMQDVTALTQIYLKTDVWANFRGEMTHCFVHPHPMDFVADIARFR